MTSSGMGRPWRVVWITGASSGIGRAVAINLAERGIKVAASARSASALAALATAHPAIAAYPLDVGDRAAQAATIAAIERDLGPIDLAILNAGVWHPGGSDTFSVTAIEQALLVNYTAAIYALDALLPRMRERKSGHIALVASVAGFIGLPNAIAYAPTKAALISLAECLKPDLARFGIAVSMINPGFVETPMTAKNTFPMPFLITADNAAKAIIRGLERKRFDIAFPWQIVTMLRLMRRLPYPLIFWILTRAGVQPALSGLSQLGDPPPS